jgi:hypothetical protein
MAYNMVAKRSELVHSLKECERGRWESGKYFRGEEEGGGRVRR